jgi:hypothetical protein
MRTRAFLTYAYADRAQSEAVYWKIKEFRPGLDVLHHPIDISFDSPKAQPVGVAIAEQIRLSDILICLCGPKAWKCRWVDWQVKMAAHLNKPILGVDLFSESGIGHHPTALAGRPMVSMDVPAILETLDRLTSPPRAKSA